MVLCLECKDSGCGNRSDSRRELPAFTSQRGSVHSAPLVFSKYYYFSFNTCVFPPALCDLRLVLPKHFSSRTFQSPMFLIPIFISLCLSCQPMAANAVRHSQLFIQHCPIWEWENDPSLYTFITLFSLPASIPKSSLGNVFNVK